MGLIKNEDDFQDWVIGRFHAVRGHVVDLSAVGGSVPDLSCAACRREYWLELKYGRFRLGHDSYDDFQFPTLSRGQLEFLRVRSAEGRSTCGVLGYMNTGEYAHFLFFATANAYLQKFWGRKVNVGGVILGPHVRTAHYSMPGRDLLNFIS